MERLVAWVRDARDERVHDARRVVEERVVAGHDQNVQDLEARLVEGCWDLVSALENLGKRVEDAGCEQFAPVVLRLAFAHFEHRNEQPQRPVLGRVGSIARAHQAHDRTNEDGHVPLAVASELAESRERQGVVRFANHQQKVLAAAPALVRRFHERVDLIEVYVKADLVILVDVCAATFGLLVRLLSELAQREVHVAGEVSGPIVDELLDLGHNVRNRLHA